MSQTSVQCLVYTGASGRWNGGEKLWRWWKVGDMNNKKDGETTTMMMSPSVEMSCTSDLLAPQWKVEELDGVFHVFLVYTVCGCGCICVFLDTRFALCMCVRQQIGAYGRSQRQFNRSLVIMIIPRSDCKHQRRKSVWEADGRNGEK